MGKQFGPLKWLTLEGKRRRPKGHKHKKYHFQPFTMFQFDFGLRRNQVELHKPEFATYEYDNNLATDMAGELLLEVMDEFYRCLNMEEFRKKYDEMKQVILEDITRKGLPS